MRLTLTMMLLGLVGCVPMDEYYMQDYDNPQWVSSPPTPNVCAASAAPNGMVTPVSASAPGGQTREPELLRR